MIRLTRLGIPVLLILLLTGLWIGCDTSEPQERRILIPRQVSEPNFTTTEEGLKYFDFTVGTGDEVTDSSVVSVYYGAWLTNDILISSRTSESTPLSVNLGSDNVIEGWALGVPGMREGGDRQLVVPPELAFGEEGRPDDGIPANATIVYEINVISVENP